MMKAYWKTLFKHFTDNIILILRTIFYRLLANPDKLRDTLLTDGKLQ